MLTSQADPSPVIAGTVRRKPESLFALTFPVNAQFSVFFFGPLRRWIAALEPDSE